MSCVRHVRGDLFAALRAILYQALVNNYLDETTIGKLYQSCEVIGQMLYIVQ